MSSSTPTNHAERPLVVTSDGEVVCSGRAALLNVDLARGLLGFLKIVYHIHHRGNAVIAVAETAVARSRLASLNEV
jgi:hypothetical protein